MTNQRSLVSHTLRYISLVLILMLAPLFFAGHFFMDSANRKSELQNLQARAGLIAQLLEIDLRSKLQSLNQSAEFLKTISLQQINREQIEFISGKFDGVAWSGLAGLDGKVKYATQGLLEGADVSKRPWFKAGQQEPSILDVHDALLLATKLPPREDQYKFIDIAVPVYGIDRQLQGVLAIHFDWSWYQKKFESLLSDYSAELPVSIVITGPSGDFRVARLSEGLGQKDLNDMLSHLRPDYQGEPDYLTYSYLPPDRSLLKALDWSINVMLPESYVMGKTNTAILISIFTLVVGMVVMSLIFLVLSKKMSIDIVEHLKLIEKESFSEVEQSEKKLPRELLPIMTKIKDLFQGVFMRAQLTKQELIKAQNSYTETNSLINQAPVALAMFDSKMCYLACSELWQKRYLPNGVDPIGKSHYDLVPGLPDAWIECHKRGMQGEVIRTYDDCWDRLDGERMWLDWTIQPWKSKSGKVGGIILATIDVTQKHLALAALEQSEERFQLAMQGSNDGLWDWHLPSNTVYFSPSWKSMLGYADDELSNSLETWNKLLHPEDRATAQEYIDQVVADPNVFAISLQFRLAHKNGDWIKVLSRGKILRDDSGKAVRLVGTHFDRTEIENLQDELQEAWVVAQAETRSNEMKSSFLATVSHEIRNPLNAVTGFSRLIADETTESNVAKYAQLLTQTTDSLRLILNDILDFAKIEAGKLEIVESVFNLSELSDALAEAVRLECVQKSISFELSKQFVSGTIFTSDVGRIRQMTQNLLSNAIKFTSSGSIKMRVVTRTLSDEKDLLSIQVIDSGIGIPDHKLAKLFKPFSQAHNDSDGLLGGTGLGLTIVKSIAEAMGGDAFCESVEGEGSTFTVEIPLRKADGFASEIKKENRSLHSRKILVVDDMPINLHILKSFLDKRGHQVITVDRGQKAVDLLQRDAFDFVLLDLDMPDMTGIEVIKTIRALNTPNVDAQFVCVTGHAMQTTAEMTKNAGFDFFLSKPIDFDVLLSILNGEILRDGDSEQALKTDKTTSKNVGVKLPSGRS